VVALDAKPWQFRAMNHRHATNTTASTLPAAGPVAIVADRGRLGPVIIVARDGQKLTFMRPDGSTQRGGPNRLYWLGNMVADGFGDVQARFVELGAIANAIDLAALHAALGPDATAPVEAARLLSLAGLADVPHADYALALAAFDDGLYFKVRDGCFEPESRADIDATLQRREEQERLQHRIDAVAERFARVLTDGPVFARGYRDDGLIGETVEDLLQTAAFGRESPAARVTEALLTSLQDKLVARDAAQRLPPSCHPDAGPRLVSRQAEDLLVALGILERHPNLAPVRAGIPRSFGAEALADATARMTSPPTLPTADLTHLRSFAIDDADTTEVDDAIALDPTNPNRVHVLIADAALWVPAGSVLDAEARQRLTTLYLPDERIPMLPAIVGEGGASLVAGARRSALVIAATIDLDGKPLDIHIQRATVNVSRQLTYDHLEGVLGGSESDSDMASLAALERLATLHRRWRHQRGAVTFQRPEINYQLRSDGHIELKVGAPLSRARQLVAEMMVMACHVAAAFCNERGIPCIYRTQAPPDELPGPPDPETGRIDDPVRQNDLMRRLKPSLMTTEMRPHWTLGVAAYAQLTSPIRRYADLVLHQQLFAWLECGEPLFSANDLETLIQAMNRTMVNVRRADQDSRRLFALRWFEQEGERVFDAVVLRDLGRRHLVDLNLLGWQDTVHLRGRRRPGQAVRVRVDSVDVENDTIHFREA
jgi:exoribonuclease-2